MRGAGSPAHRILRYGGNLADPLNRRSLFFVDLRRDATDNGSIINGVTLDTATLDVFPFTATYRVPQRAIRVSPRIDYQLNANNSLTFRYGYSQMEIPGAGIGGFNLPSRGYDVKTTTNTVQVAETAVLHSSVVNEIRFQYFGTAARDLVKTAGSSIQVLGAFSGGGATVGSSADKQSNYELQEYVSVARAKHTWRFGVRV